METGMQGLLAMKKPLVRSDLASEAYKGQNSLQKFASKYLDVLLSTCFLLTTNHNERKSPPPMAAAGLLGPNLVLSRAALAMNASTT